jgi:hypothetical protein
MRTTSSRPSRRRLHPFLFALLLGATTTASAEEARVEIVQVRATGSPTGSPVIDPRVADLPAIEGLCRMYARCEHAGTTQRRVAWGDAVVIGEGATRLEVTASRPEDDGRIPVSVRIGPADEPCLANTSSVKAGKPLVRFCERQLDDGTIIHVVTVSPL